jgi:hypothetical protein
MKPSSQYMNALFAVLSLAMAGCAAMDDVISGEPWQAYAGAARPREQIVLIKTSGMRDFFSEAYIVRIDEDPVPLKKIGGYIDALPGNHRLLVAVSHRVGGPGSLMGNLTEKRDRTEIAFDAEAGRVYVVGGTIVNDKAVVWVEDEQSGKVVAGRRP